MPEELLRELHDATQRFHEAREHLEGAMAGTEYRHQERVDREAARVREAERDLEDITRRIGETTSTPS